MTLVSIDPILFPCFFWDLFTSICFAVAMLFTTLICLAVVWCPIRSETGTDISKKQFNSGEEK